MIYYYGEILSSELRNLRCPWDNSARLSSLRSAILNLGLLRFNTSGIAIVLILADFAASNPAKESLIARQFTGNVSIIFANFFLRFIAPWPIPVPVVNRFVCPEACGLMAHS